MHPFLLVKTFSTFARNYFEMHEVPAAAFNRVPSKSGKCFDLQKVGNFIRTSPKVLGAEKSIWYLADKNLLTHYDIKGTVENNE
jgi:hypothetical protein